ncbi:branched-chain amino acid ABC transporter permease [Blastococcus sp. SYSU D00820]
MTASTERAAPGATDVPGPRRPGRVIDRGPDIWPPLIAAACTVAVLVWAHGSDYKADLVVLACTYALIALGMYIPFVLAGSLSLAYSAYAGIGAYAVGIISDRTGLSLWFGWVIGAVVAMAVSVVLSLATRRLSGFFLGAVTLLFGTAFETWLISANWLTGGSGGIGGIRTPTFFGWDPSRTVQVIMACVLVLIVAVLVDRLRRSPWGVVVRTLREAPLPVEASGVRVANMITVSLAFGAAIASIGGSLFATFVRGVTPETFTVAVVFLTIFIPLVGGRGTAWGSVLGAVVVVELTVDFDAWEISGSLILSIAVLVIMLVAPSGLLGYLDKLRHLVLALLTSRRSRGG